MCKRIERTFSWVCQTERKLALSVFHGGDSIYRIEGIHSNDVWRLYAEINLVNVRRRKRRVAQFIFIVTLFITLTVSNLIRAYTYSLHSFRWSHTLLRMGRKTPKFSIWLASELFYKMKRKCSFTATYCNWSWHFLFFQIHIDTISNVLASDFHDNVFTV